MTEPSDSTDRSDELFAEYLRRIDAGESVDLEALLQGESSDELEEAIAIAAEVEEMAGPVEEPHEASDEYYVEPTTTAVFDAESWENKFRQREHTKNLKKSGRTVQLSPLQYLDFLSDFDQDF